MSISKFKLTNYLQRDFEILFQNFFSLQIFSYKNFLNCWEDCNLSHILSYPNKFDNENYFHIICSKTLEFFQRKENQTLAEKYLTQIFVIFTLFTFFFIQIIHSFVPIRISSVDFKLLEETVELSLKLGHESISILFYLLIESDAFVICSYSNPISLIFAKEASLLNPQISNSNLPDNFKEYQDSLSKLSKEFNFSQIDFIFDFDNEESVSNELIYQLQHERRLNKRRYRSIPNSETQLILNNPNKKALHVQDITNNNVRDTNEPTDYSCLSNDIDLILSQLEASTAKVLEENDDETLYHGF